VAASEPTTVFVADAGFGVAVAVVVRADRAGAPALLASATC